MVNKSIFPISHWGTRKYNLNSFLTSLLNTGPAQLMRQVCSIRYQGVLWGSGTLKIVIYVENYPQKRFSGWLIITPYGVGGLN